METNELIRELRKWASSMAMPGRRKLVEESADRMEELDERVAIMEEGTSSDAAAPCEGKAWGTRLLKLHEAQTLIGHGWEEVWFSADEEEDEQESKELFEVVFIRGHFIAADGDIGEVYPGRYNRPFHSRLWIGKERPTDEQREAEPWNGSGDDYDENRFSGLLSED